MARKRPALRTYVGDTLYVRFNSATAVRGSDSALFLIADSFEALGVLRPRLHVGERRRLRDFSTAEFVAELNRDNEVALVGPGAGHFGDVTTYPPGPRGWSLNWRIPMPVLASSSQASGELIDWVRRLAGIADAAQAFAHSESDMAAGPVYPDLIDAWSNVEPVDTGWMFVLSAEWVDRRGRPEVLRTPAFRVEELPGGSVMLLSFDNPSDFWQPKRREAQAAMLAHLRPELNKTDVLAGLMARSERVRPETPQWPAAVAEVYQRIAARVGPSQTATQIRRLNAVPALSPSEYASAKSLGCIAQHDPETMDALESKARKLPALVRERSWIRAADALPEVDWNIWAMRLADRPDRTELVEILGAHLALLFVKNLGGTLVSGRALADTSVVVGDVAWLPFLRAKRCLASRDAVLTHSLTQLFAVAREQAPG